MNDVPRWRKLLTSGMRVVLPDVCAGCGIAGAWICDDCKTTTMRVDLSKACRRCGHPDRAASQDCARCRDWVIAPFEVRSAYEFSGAVRESILRMKYYGEHARAVWHGRELADLAVDSRWHVAALVPVPLHRNALRRRGYNQSEKLAREISKALGGDVLTCLDRLRDTPSQTRLNSSQRQINVEGAFRARDEVAGRDVVLVDDVATTGSTLVACAAALLDAGARNVRALTVATDVLTHSQR